MKKILFLLAFLLPAVTHASTLLDYIFDANYLLRGLPALIISLALMFFLWGVVKFIWNGGAEKERESGKQYMLWGLIGLAVMVSLWSLVYILAGTFGLYPQGVGVPALR